MFPSSTPARIANSLRGRKYTDGAQETAVGNDAARSGRAEVGKVGAAARVVVFGTAEVGESV